MSLKKRQDRRNKQRNREGSPVIEVTQPNQEYRREIKPLRAMNQKQQEYIESIEDNIITFAIGPAGVGKSFCPAAIAAQRLTSGDISRLIITRPGVEAGESFGFLPGLLEEKFAPYIAPFKTILSERLGKSTTEYYLKHGQILPMTLAHMRGTTFSDAMVILDEAQNTTPEQMKMFLTRIGKNCTVVIDGDISQQDIGGKSGLADALDVMRNVPGVNTVRFTMDDCVRSGIAKDILFAYAHRAK